MYRNIKIVLQYDGSRYDGWQKQGNTKNTIQGKLEAVLEKLAGEPVEIHGSGRTDAGVHALGQVANFRLEERCLEELVDKTPEKKENGGKASSVSRRSDGLSEPLSAGGYCSHQCHGGSRSGFTAA